MHWCMDVKGINSCTNMQCACVHNVHKYNSARGQECISSIYNELESFVCVCVCVLLEGLSVPHAQVLVLLKISNPLSYTSPTQD